MVIKMDLEKHFRAKIKEIETCLAFLEPGSNAYETSTALNTDMVKTTALKRDLKTLKKTLNDWEVKMKAAKALNLRILEFHDVTGKISEDLNAIKLPEPAKKTTQKTQEPKEGGEKAEKKATKSEARIHHIPILTMEEFNSIPNYMRGRKSTYEAFNATIADFNDAVDVKYTFLHKGFQAMASIENKKKYKEYRSQEKRETKGKCFLVAEDLRSLASLKTEANRKTFFTILRHLNRIQEIRGPGQIVRFCVTS